MGARSPWVVRWRVDTRKFSRAFRHRPPAEEYAARLRLAAADGERFDVTGGEPLRWSSSELTFAQWASQWLGSRWANWSPNTRRSAVEASRRNIEFGTGTEFELLSAQNNYSTALRSYTQARYDYFINLLTLKQQAGRLTERDLAQIDELLVVHDES